MPNVLFTNVRIIDGSGAQPYSGEVLVQGNRIARVAKGGRAIATAGITVIDAVMTSRSTRSSSASVTASVTASGGSKPRSNGTSESQTPSTSIFKTIVASGVAEAVLKDRLRGLR